MREVRIVVLTLVVVGAGFVALVRLRQAPEVAAEPEVQAAAAPATPAAAPDPELEAARRRGVEKQQREAVLDQQRAAEEADTRRREAIHAVPITMYSTSWCPVCRKARSFFNANGLRFVERDVEKDAEAAVLYRRLNPSGGVPTIDIEGQVFIGFRPRAMAEALETAAARRL